MNTTAARLRQTRASKVVARYPEPFPCKKKEKNANQKINRQDSGTFSTQWAGKQVVARTEGQTPLNAKMPNAKKMACATRAILVFMLSWKDVRHSHYNWRKSLISISSRIRASACSKAPKAGHNCQYEMFVHEGFSVTVLERSRTGVLACN